MKDSQLPVGRTNGQLFFVSEREVLKKVSVKSDKLVARWVHRIFLMRISVPMILITAIISFAVAGVTIYGNNVGNFVVSVDNSLGLNFSLNDTGSYGPNNEYGTTTLYGPGLTGMLDATIIDPSFRLPSVEKLDEMFGDNSDFNTRKYLAYGFTIKNVSSIDGGYRLKLNCTEQYQNVLSALRIMVVIDGEEKIYAQASSNGLPINGVIDPDSALGKNNYEDRIITFVDDYTLIDFTVPLLKAGKASKYGIMMWLEGFDPDCNDKIMGGSIRLDMTFTSLPLI